jgi:hypothetical protein
MPSLTIAFPTLLHLFSSSTFLRHHDPFLFPVHKPSFEATFVPLIFFLFDFLFWISSQWLTASMALFLLLGWSVGRFGLWSYVQTVGKVFVTRAQLDAIWLVSTC